MTSETKRFKEFLRRMRALKQVQNTFGCVLELEIAHGEQP